MIVMVLHNVPPSLRGQLSRYLFETADGVFVGDLSARVRDKLWTTCERQLNGGAVFQVWSTDNEQGYSMRMAGGKRTIEDWEGLLVVTEPGRELTPAERKRVKGKA